MATANINGIEIYYEEHGDAKAEPVLLIMGFMTNAGAWVGQIPALAERYRVIAFDNRGCGRSSQPDGPYTMQQFADDAMSLLDHVGVDSAHVVGASMGGMIAQHVALEYPERIRSLSLLCTTPGGPRSFGHAEMQEAAAMFEGATDLAEFETPERIQEGMLASFTPEFIASPNETFLQTAITTVQFPSTLAGVKGQFAAVMGHDTVDRLGEIKAPTLVLTGDADGLVDYRNSELLAERIPGAQLRVFPGLRHAFNVESPEAINEALLAFLSQHSRVRAA